MPKTNLPSNKGPTISYAIIVRETTLANKRTGVMPLAHILKFIKENPVSTGAQYVTLQKYFSHSNLLVYFFATPPIKLKTGIANKSGSRNSKPPGPIMMLGQ